VNSHLCSRVHFFTEDIGGVLEFFEGQEKFTGTYLGYSIVRPVPDRCIGRTVIDPARLGIDFGESLFCLRTSFNVHCYGVDLPLKGYPYMAQDNEAMVCAHSALWGACRYLSERYTMYPEVHPFDLVKMTGKEQGRTFPRRGMVYSDYSSILTDFGTFPVIIRTKVDPVKEDEPRKEEFRNLCTYVESGFPVMVSVYNPKNGMGHAVAAIGHTTDYSLGKPDTEGLIDHTEFFKQLVVVDDNVFPYQRLGAEGDADNYAGKYKPEFRFSLGNIHTAVCPLPEKVFLTAGAVRPIVEKYLRDQDVWTRIKQIGQAPWVKRLFLTTCYSFKKQKMASAVKKDLGYAKNLDLILALTHMPHFIWVMQISPRSLYTLKNEPKCTAEIVLDATAGKNDNPVIYIRAGKTLIYPGMEKPFSSEDADEAFDLYQHNLGEGNTV
jgi:hypothetical protein